jgi:outer membrane receptor protein involved in Fe transport
VLASGLPAFNSTGADTVSYTSKGYEFETVANLSKNWRLIWNLSTGDVTTFDRFTALKAFKAAADAAGLTTTATSAFLKAAPDGTPIPGFMNIKSNLVTRYGFEDGLLKGFNIGGGLQYRGQGFRGNFDLDRDGIAEELWSPEYVVWNLSVGYRMKVFSRPMSLSLNVNNIFDKVSYRSTSVSSGSWSQRRTFTLALRTQL